MSPRRHQDLRIALPPRNMRLLQVDPDSSPSTPSPHTPLPFEFAASPSVASHGADDMYDFPSPLLTASSESSGAGPVAGSKRSREEEDDAAEGDWTEEELGILQATLMHPYRPLSQTFPPGQLPPPNIIDELASQILAYALRHSPVKRAQPTPTPTPRPGAGHGQEAEGWRHSWTATRRRLFDLALADSRFGHDQAERKLSREERKHRPGLRRMDSMDFLDEAEQGDDAPSDSVGKAIRLSTSLQNSAKQDTGLGKLARSASYSAIPDRGSADTIMSPSTSTPPATITLTPASPQSRPPPLRRQGSFRNVRQSRPSLLQRGRSFTASDLQNEADAQERAASSSSSPITAEPVEQLSISDALHAPQAERLPIPSHAPRLTRSQSSTSAFDKFSSSSLCKDFLSGPRPSTTDRSMLAQPLALELPSPAPSPKKGGGWSDSDDEQPSKPRNTKKIRPMKAVKKQPLRIIANDQILSAGGLRSPFEEKEAPF